MPWHNVFAPLLDNPVPYVASSVVAIVLAVFALVVVPRWRTRLAEAKGYQARARYTGKPGTSVGEILAAIREREQTTIRRTLVRDALPA